jgi:uncharacterized coiled-coil protein SlyX
MATSSKVSFKLEKLQERAVKSIDARITSQKERLERLKSDDALVVERAEWRAKQEERLRSLVANLRDLDDHALAAWKVDDIPTVDRYERTRAERDLQVLEATKSQILAKSDSLVPDADGNISLTKTQLAEFFGL